MRTAIDEYCCRCSAKSHQVSRLNLHLAGTRPPSHPQQYRPPCATCSSYLSTCSVQPSQAVVCPFAPLPLHACQDRGRPRCFLGRAILTQADISKPLPSREHSMACLRHSQRAGAPRSRAIWHPSVRRARRRSGSPRASLAGKYAPRLSSHRCHLSYQWSLYSA